MTNPRKILVISILIVFFMMVNPFVFPLKDTHHLANRAMNSLAANATNTYNDSNPIFFKSPVVMQRASKDRARNS